MMQFMATLLFSDKKYIILKLVRILLIELQRRKVVESKKRAITGFYIVLLIICAGMLYYADTFAIQMREMVEKTYESVKYGVYAILYQSVLTLLICTVQFIGRFVKQEIYVVGSAAMIIFLAFLLYMNLFLSAFKFLIVISIVFIAEFVFWMVERKMNI